MNTRKGTLHLHMQKWPAAPVILGTVSSADPATQQLLLASLLTQILGLLALQMKKSHQLKPVQLLVMNCNSHAWKQNETRSRCLHSADKTINGASYTISSSFI